MNIGIGEKDCFSLVHRHTHTHTIRFVFIFIVCRRVPFVPVVTLCVVVVVLFLRFSITVVSCVSAYPPFVSFHWEGIVGCSPIMSQAIRQQIKRNQKMFRKRGEKKSVTRIVAWMIHKHTHTNTETIWVVLRVNLIHTHTQHILSFYFISSPFFFVTRFESFFFSLEKLSLRF